MSNENRALLRVIRESRPESLVALAHLAGRQPSSLSRTLKKMAGYGLVKMRPDNGGWKLRPVFEAKEFRILAVA